MRLGREFDIIKGIVNTEKTSRALAESKYTFNVDTNANKDEIKSAIEKVFVATWSTFSQVDKQKLDDILANSSPSFAKHIIDLMFENAYANDLMCSLVFSTILPYAKNELVYDANEFNEKILNSFEKVISKVYEQSFMFLLTHTLENSEIDKYIERVSE